MSSEAQPDLKRYLYGIEKYHPEALKILFLASDTTGCSWYRGRRPAFAINRDYSDKLNQVVARSIIETDETPGAADPVWNIIVHQRQINLNIVAWAKRLTAKFKTIHVYESDDDFWNIDVNSPAKASFPPETLKNMQAYVREMDYVTVSTQGLKNIYEPMCPRVEVLPNAVDFEVVDKCASPPPDSGQIIIGWSGTHTHLSDLKIIFPVMAEILKANKHVVFEIGGFPDCPLIADLPQAQVKVTGWMNNMEDYYSSLYGRHIALAPLVDSTFNRSKSNIKYLENAACGVPVIASDVLPYAQTIKNGVNGLLVKSKGAVFMQWKKAIQVLIDDAALRKTMGAAGRQTVKQNFDQVKIAQKWAEFYMRIAKEKGLRG